MPLPAASSLAVEVVVVVAGAGAVVGAGAGVGVGGALPAASTIAESVAKQMSFENIIIIILFESTCFD